MASVLAISCVPALFYVLFSRYKSLRNNISLAKQSGLPYEISPVYILETWWMVSQDLLIPVLRLLPERWTETWLPFCLYTKAWQQGHSPFSKLHHDTFILCSPSGNLLWTCEPQVTHQLYTRGTDFIKPVKMMGMLNIYGPTLVASDGEEARLYRKITGPSFNEKNHERVWIETLKQAGHMVNDWYGNAITTLHSDVSRGTLHVFSSVCLSHDIEWTKGRNQKDFMPKGHTLSWADAIDSVLNHAITIFTTPRFLLKNSPLPSHQKAYTAFVEWGNYMNELCEETEDILKQKNEDDNLNLVESLVKAGQPRDSMKPLLSPESVLGNIFIFIFTGHEATANTLAYAILLLACRPKFQRSLQKDLDNLLGDKPENSWSFKTDFPKLLDGYVGAVMNETLRHYSIVPFLLKATDTIPRSLKLGDKNYTIPPDTFCFIHKSATYHNPKWWPSKPKEDKSADGPPDPVSTFDPDQWMVESEGKGGRAMLIPEPGSFVPFSEGQRGCIGKRFAQVEFCAAIASIFKKYSIELDVDGAQTVRGYEKARRNAEWQLSTGIEFGLTLKLSKDIPVRLVRRGEEKWM